jgi:hypothetical protein
MKSSKTWRTDCMGTKKRWKRFLKLLKTVVPISNAFKFYVYILIFLFLFFIELEISYIFFATMINFKRLAFECVLPIIILLLNLLGLLFKIIETKKEIGRGDGVNLCF